MRLLYNKAVKLSVFDRSRQPSSFSIHRVHCILVAGLILEFNLFHNFLRHFSCLRLFIHAHVINNPPSAKERQRKYKYVWEKRMDGNRYRVKVVFGCARVKNARKYFWKSCALLTKPPLNGMEWNGTVLWVLPCLCVCAFIKNDMVRWKQTAKWNIHSFYINLYVYFANTHNMYDLIVRKSSATEWIENAKNEWRIKLLSWQVV